MIQSEVKEWFAKLCIRNGLKPSIDQLEKLDRYARLLLEWNKKINLISRKDEENVWTYHILHSISLLFKINFKNNCSIVDIGTGGGLPGIPVKILRPDISMLCIDSTGKKIKALEQIVSALSLDRIKIVWGRAEEICLRPEFTRKFDYALARAVAPLDELITWSEGFFCDGQSTLRENIQNADARINITPPALLAYKGGDIAAEVETARKKHSKIDVEIIDLVFPGGAEFISFDKKILVVHF